MWPKQKLLMLVWKYAKVIHCKYLKYRKYKKCLCYTYLFVILYFSITGVNGTLMIRLQKVVTISGIVLHWTKTVLVAKVANQIVQKIVSTAVEELNSLSTMTCSKIHHKNMKYTFKQHTIIYTVFWSSLCIRTYKYGIEVPEYRLLTGGGLPLKNGDTAEYFEGIDLTSMNNGQYLPCEPFSIFPFGIRGAVGVAAYVMEFSN